MASIKNKKVPITVLAVISQNILRRDPNMAKGEDYISQNLSDMVRFEDNHEKENRDFQFFIISSDPCILWKYFGD